MNTVKKYWWVGLLALLVVLWLVWMKRTKNGQASITCKKKSPEDYGAALAYMESQIDQSEEWKATVLAQTENINHNCFNKTYEECRGLNADYWLTKKLDYCPQI